MLDSGLREGVTVENKLLEVRNLKTYFYGIEGIAKALGGVSFDIKQNETLGIVGESGCGKSVTARSILRILDSNGKIIDGKILFRREGEVVDLAKMNKKGSEIRKIRGKEISMIFQEPMTSFSPVYTIGNQIMEAIILHQKVSKKEARESAFKMLERVNIPNAEKRIDSYPHELSGGMRQRAMIAMALVCQPKLLIADEPTTALDVTIQAQILRLLKELQNDFGMSIMIITHNLGVISEIADRVIVMYLGKVVEDTTVKELFHNPLHPYTKALLQSLPKFEKKHRKRLETIEGMVPDTYDIPTGCSFHDRCDKAIDGLCNVMEPIPINITPEHKVSCFLYGDGGENNE